MRRTTSAILAMMLAGVAPVMAQTPTEEKAFETALAAHDLTAASAHLDRLIVARIPADGKAASDPYLNLRIGRFLLAAGQTSAALPWLERASDAAATDADRVRLKIDTARALLTLGQADAALPLFAEALRTVSDPRDRSMAQRLQIDALLVTDPTAAVRTLAASSALRASDTLAEWDWALLDARAALLTEARTAGDKVRYAWSQAPTAPLSASAPARAAAMMAILEEGAGNRAGALAMLAAATRAELDSSAISKKITAALPTCGGTLAPSDHVTVAFHRDSYSRATRMSAIAASRPEAVPHFLAGVQAEAILDSTFLTTAAAVARLSCRISPTSDAPALTGPADPAALFMAQRGLYPRMGRIGTSEERLNATSREVDELTRRFGPENPLLLGPLLTLVLLSQERLMQAGDIPPPRLLDLNNRLARVLRAVGDTTAFLPPDTNYPLALAQAINATSREAASEIMASSFRSYVERVDFAIAYMVLGSAGEMDPAQLDTLRADLIDRGMKTLSPDDPRLLSLRIERARAARNTTDGTFASRAKETGLPRDLCVLQQEIPRLRQLDITDDDYPADGLVAELTGRTTLEFDVDAAGQKQNVRTIVALPPILFDQVIAKRTGGISYFPARANGRATSCRGLVQAILWKMPDRDDGNEDMAVPMNWTPGT